MYDSFYSQAKNKWIVFEGHDNNVICECDSLSNCNIVVAALNSDEDKIAEESYNDGYSDGTSAGYSDGYDSGHSDGFDEGYAAGKEERE